MSTKLLLTPLIGLDIRETVLLKQLHEQRGAMTFLSLKHRVAAEAVQPYITREELQESILLLEDLGLVEEQKDLLGLVRFSLTLKGALLFEAP